MANTMVFSHLSTMLILLKLTILVSFIADNQIANQVHINAHAQLAHAQ